MDHKVLRSIEFSKFLLFLSLSLKATRLKQGIAGKHDAESKCLVVTGKKIESHWGQNFGFRNKSVGKAFTAFRVLSCCDEFLQWHW